MIKRLDVATEINKLMLDFGAKLDNSVAFVQRECDKKELDDCRQAVGKIMGDMLFGVMNPLYETHPDLIPDKMKD